MLLRCAGGRNAREVHCDKRVCVGECIPEGRCQFQSLAQMLATVADVISEVKGLIERSGRVPPGVITSKLTKMLDASCEGLAENQRVHPCGIDATACVGTGFGGCVSPRVVA